MICIGSSVMESTYTPTPSREAGDTDRSLTKTDSGRGNLFHFTLHTVATFTPSLVFPVIRGADIVAQTTLRREESNPQHFSQEVHFTGIHEPTSIVLSRDPATPEGLFVYPSVCYGENNSKSDECEPEGCPEKYGVCKLIPSTLSPERQITTDRREECRSPASDLSLSKYRFCFS